MTAARGKAPGLPSTPHAPALGDSPSFRKTDAFGINGDGAYPNAGLILSGNTLYGTASRGGSLGSGTVFKVNTDGTRFTSLHSFTATDGADPVAGLILSGGTLYGTTAYGGSSGNG